MGNYPDAGLAESRDQAYNPQPKGPGGAHCQKCSSEPTDLSISCGCRLSFECRIGVGLEVQVRVLCVWKGFRWGLDWFGSIFKKF